MASRQHVDLWEGGKPLLFTPAKLARSMVLSSLTITVLSSCSCSCTLELQCNLPLPFLSLLGDVILRCSTSQ